MGDDECWSVFDSIYAYARNNPERFLWVGSRWLEQAWLDELGTWSKTDLEDLYDFLTRPSPQAPQPLRINIKDTGLLGEWGIKGLEIIEMPHPHQKHEAQNALLSRAFGAIGVACDIGETFGALGIRLPYVDQRALSFIDVVATMASSGFGGSGMQREKIHESLPEMYIFPQDVLFTASEAMGAPLLELLIPKADVATSIYSIYYDLTSLAGKMTTRVELGFYYDESVRTKIPLDFVPQGQPTFALIIYPRG
jgi:hypothetical protein